MADLKRRSVLVLFSALAITTVGKREANSFHAAAHKPIMILPDVYGTEKVAETDPAQLSVSLLKQFKAAALPEPEMNVFPELRDLKDRVEDWLDSSSQATGRTLGMSEISAPLEGDMVPPHGIFGTQYRINGLPSGTTGDDFLTKLTADKSKDQILSGGCKCGNAHNRLKDNYSAFRIFAALHESGHFVSAVKGLDDSTLKTIGRGDKSAPISDAGFKTDIQERIADTAASLYLMSNYGDAKPYLQDVQTLRSAMLDPTHYTASSINAGIAAFEVASRKGVSIVEATQWAADIVGQQPGLVAEFKMAAASHIAARDGTIDALPADGKAMVQKAVKGRRALFGAASG